MDTNLQSGVRTNIPFDSVRKLVNWDKLDTSQRLAVAKKWASSQEEPISALKGVLPYVYGTANALTSYLTALRSGLSLGFVRPGDLGDNPVDTASMNAALKEHPTAAMAGQMSGMLPVLGVAGPVAESIPGVGGGAIASTLEGAGGFTAADLGSDILHGTVKPAGAYGKSFLENTAMLGALKAFPAVGRYIKGKVGSKLADLLAEQGGEGEGAVSEPAPELEPGTTPETEAALAEMRRNLATNPKASVEALANSYAQRLPRGPSIPSSAFGPHPQQLIITPDIEDALGATRGSGLPGGPGGMLTALPPRTEPLQLTSDVTAGPGWEMRSEVPSGAAESLLIRRALHDALNKLSSPSNVRMKVPDTRTPTEVLADTYADRLWNAKAPEAPVMHVTPEGATLTPEVASPLKVERRPAVEPPIEPGAPMEPGTPVAKQIIDASSPEESNLLTFNAYKDQLRHLSDKTTKLVDKFQRIIDRGKEPTAKQFSELWEQERVSSYVQNKINAQLRSRVLEEGDPVHDQRMIDMWKDSKLTRPQRRALADYEAKNISTREAYVRMGGTDNLSHNDIARWEESQPELTPEMHKQIAGAYAQETPPPQTITFLEHLKENAEANKGLGELEAHGWEKVDASGDVGVKAPDGKVVVFNNAEEFNEFMDRWHKDMGADSISRDKIDVKKEVNC